MLFTKESRFSLMCDTRRVLVWIEVAARNNRTFLQERSEYRQVVLLVWNGISIYWLTDFHLIRNDTLTAQRYAHEILRFYVVQCAADIGNSIHLMDDNARPHRTSLVKNMLITRKMHCKEWPAWFADHATGTHSDTLARPIPYSWLFGT